MADTLSPPGGVFTGSTTTVTAAPTGTTTTTIESNPTSSSSPSFSYFESRWYVPVDFVENQAQDIFWQIPELPTYNDTIFKPALFLCHTNTSVSLMNSTNTWSIAQVPNDFCTGCVVQNGAVYINTITFLAFSGFNPLPEDFYFFCISNSPLYINAFVCDSYGPTFSIKGATSTTRRNRRDLIERQLQTYTPATYMPTTLLSITQYTAAVSILNGVPVTTSPGTITGLITTTQGVRGTTTLTVQPTSSETQGSTPSDGHPGGLSTGIKAGISIAAILVVIILFGVLLFLSRRKQRTSRTHGAVEKPMRPNTHELLTNANSHELFTKHNIPEMDEQDRGALKAKQKLVPVIAGIGLENEGAVSREDLAAVHELDPKSHITALDTEDYLPSPHELETSSTRPSLPSTTLADSSRVPALQGEASSSKDNPPAVNEEQERKVELLTDRINRIREEKERLERIQELKDLEEQTKREILAAWREDGERSQT